MRRALPWPLAAGLATTLPACGQYVRADQALGGESNAGTVELATRDELAEATALLHYGQEALLGLHTDPGEYRGGAVRNVDYAAMLASPEARLVVADSLANLASVDPALLASPAERLAFWLNLYNLAVVGAVLGELQADAAWTGVSADEFAMFTVPLVQVGGRVYSLNAVEHAIIRGDAWSLENYVPDQADRDQAAAWHETLWEGGPVDARIHVGLNCASMGCPDVLDGAFRAEDLDAELDALATAFVDHPGKGAGPDGVSQLFSWFGADFAGSHGSVEGFVRAYRTGGDADVDYSRSLDYDWSLNATP